MSMESDDVEACSSTSEISEDFSVPGTSQSWRSQSLSLPQFPPDLVDELQPVENHGWIIPSKHTERLRRLGTPAQKICRRRNQSRKHSGILHKFRQDNNPTFPPRTITAIDEEKVVSWHFCENLPSSREIRIHNNSMTNEFQTSKLKFCKESDEMKRIVSRLKKMAETKPEMLKDTLSDETIKLFKSIHIK